MAYHQFFPGIVLVNYQDAKRFFFTGKQGRVVKSYSTLQDEKKRKRQLEKEENFTIEDKGKLLEKQLLWNPITKSTFQTLTSLLRVTLSNSESLFPCTYLSHGC